MAAADEDMEEDIKNIENYIKMEIDIDQEEMEDCNFKLEYEYDAAEEMLKNIYPVVYTTKLDDMKTLNKNLKGLNAREITTMLLAESKPTHTLTSQTTPLGTENLQSYLKLASTVHYIKFKAKRQAYITKVRNMKLLKQCKPFSIILKDYNILKNVSHDSQKHSATTDLPNGMLVKVKVEAIDLETCELQNKSDVLTDSADKETNQGQAKNEVTDISKTKSCELQHSTKENMFLGREHENTKKIESQPEKAENVPSAKKIKTVKQHHASRLDKTKTEKTPSKRASTTFSDEDNTALIHFKSKPAAAPQSAVNALEKFTVVMLQSKKRETFLYRFNLTRLIADYYKTPHKDKLVVGTLFPKEEKFIEQYCCWLSREEAISKICTRKAYGYTIQHFLSQPHSCLGYCECCCSKKLSNQSTQSQTQRHDIITKSHNAADSWIRRLLSQNQPANIGVVGKALSYIPKNQVKQVPVKKEPEKYLEAVVLFINNTGSINDNFKYFAELYEFGKNGNVVSSYLLSDQKNSTYIRRKYSLLGFKCIDTQFCCWYAREKLMLNLRVSKVSPAALKLIQQPHYCKSNNCDCCCKPHTIPLKPIKALPKSLNHTSAYEKKARILTIRFNVHTKLSKNQIKKLYANRNKTSHDNIFSQILSTSANKKSIQELCTFISSKFKYLKLEVNSNGKLEAILNGPASNLSVAELKDLSDVLALSTKQITELGLPAEEFCNRVNESIGPSNIDVAKETILISTPETIPSSLSPETYDKHTPEPPKLVVNITPTVTLQKKIAPVDDPIKYMTPTFSKDPISNQFKNTLSSISNLMETKNKNYVESFKLFFKNNDSTNVTKPKNRQFNSDAVTNSVESVSLPKIVTAFTLSKSSSDGHRLAGLSGISNTTRQHGTILDTTMDSKTAIGKESVKEIEIKVRPNSPLEGAEFSNINETMTTHTEPNNNTRTATKRKDSFNQTQSVKRIRVKSPSELMAQNTGQTPDTGNVLVKSLPSWPAPILIKREPHTNIQSIVSHSAAAGIKTTTNLQTQRFIYSNNVVTTPPIQLANKTTTSVKNMYKLNGNSITNVSTALTSNSNGGLCYITLTPLSSDAAAASNNNQPMLARILKTPQVQPTVAPAGNNLLQLVPIIPVKVVPKSALKIIPVSENNANQPVAVKTEIICENDFEIDVENSIHCNVLKKS